MKFDAYVSFTLEALDVSKKKKFIVLIPGGFKPPTAGHMHLIEGYNNNPNVEKVIVLVGPVERDGITRDQSLKLFGLYGIDNLNKVSLEKTDYNNPMTAAYEFLISDPRKESYKGLVFGMGASDKGGDEERSYKFAEYFKTHPDKLPSGYQVGVPPIIPAAQVDDSDVSATKLRKAIQDQDPAAIQKLIPSGVKVENFLSLIRGK
jgi:hypothetical protein